jgi:hypothetical protein
MFVVVSGSKRIGKVYLKPGYRIGCFDEVLLLNSSDLVFARKIDVDLAIKALHEASLFTIDDILERDLSDHTLLSIVCQHLQW